MRAKTACPSLSVERLDDRVVPTVTFSGNSQDFHINIDAGESVVLGISDNAKLVVLADGEEVGNIQQAASSFVKITITATGEFANTIDLTGITPADFVSLTQLAVDTGGGNDTVRGSVFGDVLFGNGGNDTIYGGMGNDKLYGSMGDDRLYGGKGNDWMYGGKGNDWLFGQAGNDMLVGQAGADTFSGGLGNDTIVRDPFDIVLDP
jgi:Ca2+-binding RTX toxin-like protein